MGLFKPLALGLALGAALAAPALAQDAGTITVLRSSDADRYDPQRSSTLAAATGPTSTMRAFSPPDSNRASISAISALSSVSRASRRALSASSFGGFLRERGRIYARSLSLAPRPRMSRNTSELARASSDSCVAASCLAVASPTSEIASA